MSPDRAHAHQALQSLRPRVGAAFADRTRLNDPDSRAAVEGTISALDRGDLRVATPPEAEGEAWITHAWIKQAILLFFAMHKNEVVRSGAFEYADKVPVKHDFILAGVRVVPPAVARFGSFLEPGVILMPSYVNIGARVGSGTMVDTWATVGSGAQIRC